MSVIQALLLCCYCLLVLLACSTSEAAVVTRSLEDNSTPMHSQSEQQSNSTAPASPTSSEITTTPPQCPQGNVTSTTNDTVVLQHLKQLRLASIRAQILAKFGLSEPPDNSDTNPLSGMDEETMATYYQFLSASGEQGRGRGEEEECESIRGEKSTFYAKELRLHFPSSFHPIIPSIEIFEWGEENNCIVCMCVHIVYMYVCEYKCVCTGRGIN